MSVNKKSCLPLIAKFLMDQGWNKNTKLIIEKGTATIKKPEAK